MKVVFVDGERVRPGDVLSGAVAADLYVLPLGRPWSRVLQERLRARGAEVRFEDEFLEVEIDQGGVPLSLRVPLAPPWCYLGLVAGHATVIGRGGQSVVLGTAGMGQTWAVKVMDVLEARDTRYVESLLARQKIPGLMPITAVATDAEHIYLLMPMAEGDVRQAPEPLPCLYEGARALFHFHQAGWVHNDVKPSNFLVYRGTTYLADAGAAMRAGSLFPNSFRISPSYAAPEVIRYWQSRLDYLRARPELDVFSFACVVYKVLTGRSIYGESRNRATRAVMAALRGCLPQPDMRGIPDGVARVLVPSLAVDPRQRPGMDAWVAALQPYRRTESHDPVSAPAGHRKPRVL